jgi:hypothetical protein
VTKQLPFTENAIARVVNGARKGGIKVGAVEVSPDGRIRVLDEKLVPVPEPKQDSVPAPSRWDN